MRYLHRTMDVNKIIIPTVAFLCHFYLVHSWSQHFGLSPWRNAHPKSYVIQNLHHPSTSLYSAPSRLQVHLNSRRLCPVLLWGRDKDKEQEDKADEFDRRLKELQSQVTSLQAAVDQKEKESKSAPAASKVPPMALGAPLSTTGVLGPYLRYGMYSFPEEERLLLSSAAVGVIFGTIVGKILRLPTVGAVCGVIFTLKHFDRKGTVGKFIRMMGKLGIIVVHQVSVFIRDFESNWKAWRVYEKMYRQYERFDNRFNITRSFYSFDDKYKITPIATTISNQVTGASNFIWNSMVSLDDVWRNNLWPKKVEGPMRGLSSKVIDQLDSLSRKVEAQYELSSYEMAKAKDNVAKFNEDWASKWSDFKIEMPMWKVSSSKNSTSTDVGNHQTEDKKSPDLTVNSTSEMQMESDQKSKNQTKSFMRWLGK